MVQRGRSTYYRMQHFIVGEASSLCPAQAWMRRGRRISYAAAMQEACLVIVISQVCRCFDNCHTIARHMSQTFATYVKKVYDICRTTL